MTELITRRRKVPDTPLEALITLTPREALTERVLLALLALAFIAALYFTLRMRMIGVRRKKVA